MAHNSEKIVIKQISEIVPYVNNPRNNKEAVDLVAASISEFGFKNPIILDSKNVIVAGHTRFAAAKKLGLKEVPCIMADDLTEQQIKAFRLADNKVAEAATWDMDLLKIELDGITDIDMSNLGFDDISLGDETGEGHSNVNEDDVPEKPDEPNTKVGDIYQLGKHRLICGDSTDVAVIDRLMDGVKAKLLLTDPPYGIKADKGFSGAGGFSGKGKPIERRHYKDEWDSERPEKDVFDYICLMAENAIIFGGNFFTDELPVGNHWLVWNKHNTMPTFSDAELAWTNVKRNSVKMYDVEWNGLIGKEKERFHPTQKPVKLFADILNDYTEKDDTICDFFGGSGSTLIACEQLNRKCYMAELDPKYCDVIIARWEKLTGKKAERIN